MHQSSRPLSVLTREDALNFARAYLKRSAVAAAALDARVLTCAACDISNEELIRDGDIPIALGVFRRLEKFLIRRSDGEPVSRILGKREFYGLEFKICSATLDPRPDSEVLVDAIKKLDLPTFADVLDLGTGSGCLLITLLHQYDSWHGLGVDISAHALRTSRINAARLGVRDRAAFRQSDWFTRVFERYDLIVTNPPYIAHDDIRGLEKEVRIHDPIQALDGGFEGLDPYRLIIKRASQYITAHGWLICEIGHDQERAVRLLFSDGGFDHIECGKDLSGRARFVLGQRN